MARKSFRDYAIDATVLSLGILELDGNSSCFDCGSAHPDWCSMHFGLLICLKCCGEHRSFGAHITRVKSLKLDSWDGELESARKERQFLALGGNENFEKYLKAIHYEVARESDGKLQNAREMYNSREVRYYREILLGKVEGRAPISHYEFLTKCSDEEGFNNDDDEDDYEGEYEDGDRDGASKKEKERDGKSVFIVGDLEATQEGTTPWVPDIVCNRCMICNIAFNIVRRKHHCRKCGKCVCEDCAPSKNTRPILEQGLREPVRHCKNCYRSPAVAWLTSFDLDDA